MTRRPTTRSERPQDPDVSVFMPMYPREYLAGPAFAMTNQQRGMQMQLLMHAWIATPPASLPDDDRLLAKYADEPLAVWMSEGRVVRAEWRTPAEMHELGHDVPNDARLRNPWQWGQYVEALARRKQNQQRAKVAAEKRWGRESSAGMPPDVLAKALEASPALVAWIGASQRRRELFEAFVLHVYDHHPRVETVLGFAAECVVAFDGMHGPVVSPEQLEIGMNDWTLQDTKGNLLFLRECLKRAARPQLAAGERRPRTSAIAAAGSAAARNLTVE